jgi:hypothetical protein
MQEGDTTKETHTQRVVDRSINLLRLLLVYSLGRGGEWPFESRGGGGTHQELGACQPYTRMLTRTRPAGAPSKKLVLRKTGFELDSQNVMHV